jgi:hypothetical protein
MPYRRPPQNTKRFLPPLLSFNTSPRRTAPSPYPGQSSHKDFLDIPLPNEQEYTEAYHEERRILPGLSSVVDFVREHIHIEELILIGLIILLLDESMEDNLLLVLLFYILIF